MFLQFPAPCCASLAVPCSNREHQGARCRVNPSSDARVASYNNTGHGGACCCKMLCFTLFVVWTHSPGPGGVYGRIPPNQFFILRRFLTIPWHGEGPRRPNIAKHLAP